MIQHTSGNVILTQEEYQKLEAEIDRIKELYDGRPEAFHGHLKKRAKELEPDYPYTQEDPFEWLWAITSSLEGTRLANDDCHKEILRLREEIRRHNNWGVLDL